MPDLTDSMELLAAALDAGGRIVLPSAGASMGTAFANAAAVQVDRPDRRRLRIGAVIVYRRAGAWIAHRVVWVFPPSSPWLCVTKADGVNALDRPFVRAEEWLGIVSALRFGEQWRDLAGSAARWRGVARALSGLARIPFAAVLRRGGISRRPPPRGMPPTPAHRA
jgi:hypothetical protein